MKEESFVKIEKNLSKLSAIFAAVGSIAITVEQTGINSISVTGENLELITNLNYLAEIKDDLIDEVLNELAAIRKDLDVLKSDSNL